MKIIWERLTYMRVRDTVMACDRARNNNNVGITTFAAIGREISITKRAGRAGHFSRISYSIIWRAGTGHTATVGGGMYILFARHRRDRYYHYDNIRVHIIRSSLMLFTVTSFSQRACLANLAIVVVFAGPDLAH